MDFYSNIRDFFSRFFLWCASCLTWAYTRGGSSRIPESQSVQMVAALDDLESRMKALELDKSAVSPTKKSSETAEKTGAEHSTMSEPKGINLKPTVLRCDWAKFYPKVKMVPNPQKPGHSIESLPARELHAIEVLYQEPGNKEAHSERKRRFAQSELTTQDYKNLPESVPSRLRIRSLPLLTWLEGVTSSQLFHHTGTSGRWSANPADRPSLTFLHPFKFFVTYEQTIKEQANLAKVKLLELRIALETSGKPEATTLVTEGIVNEKSTDRGHTLQGSGSNAKVPGQVPELSLGELGALIELIEKDLYGVFNLRHAFANTLLFTVRFDEMWLLYRIGELLYERATGSNDRSGFPPRILKVIQFDGGRKILNNTKFSSPDPSRPNGAAGNKGLENVFFIKTISLNFDGEKYGPVEHTMTIPSWDGRRHIHELKVFPLRFCRPELDFSHSSYEEWMKSRKDNGKSFANLRVLELRYYNGYDLGAKRAHYASQIIIDFKLSRQEQTKDADRKESPAPLLAVLGLARNLSDPGKGLSSFIGDNREVLEGTLFDKSQECLTPGCHKNDFLHDDILLDYQITEEHITKLGPSAAMFEDPNCLNDSHEEDYVLFPNHIKGFVLNERIWADLNIDFLEKVKIHKRPFESLQLPDGHKEVLLASIKGWENTSNQIQLDPIPGKGQGLIILLHGHPGVGKTMTAEAIAAYTHRPLYPISCGDLGESAQVVEKNLKQILQHGHRWGCVLLLDEADVFLVKRDNKDIQRNSIVSVFLRHLEYYSGILFLTTNKPTAFDEAILSRIHIPLGYPTLTIGVAAKIWSDLFDKFVFQGADSSPQVTFDRPKLAEWTNKTYENAEKKCKESNPDGVRSKTQNPWGSGRQIRNAFQVAMALAKYDKHEGQAAELTEEHLGKVANLFETFHEEMRKQSDR